MSDLTWGDQVRITIDGVTVVQDFTTDTNTTMAAFATKIVSETSATAASHSTVSTGANDGKMTITSAGTIGKIQINNGNLSTQAIDTTSHAQTSIASINAAIADVDSYRATLGAIANRMEHAANNLMSRVEHQQSARSRIQDADYAVESANLAKAQVLQQAGTAMLAQANASSQNILSLLK